MLVIKIAISYKLENYFFIFNNILKLILING